MTANDFEFIIPTPTDVEYGQAFSGRNTVDLLYKTPEKLYIAEAKGGTSGVGTRKTVAPSLTEIGIDAVTQGEYNYLVDIAYAMSMAKSGPKCSQENGCWEGY